MIANPKLYSWKAIHSTNDKDDTHCCQLKYVSGDDHHSHFMYGISNLPNIMLPGVCVSMWRHTNNIQDVSMEVTDAVQENDCKSKAIFMESNTFNQRQR